MAGSIDLLSISLRASSVRFRRSSFFCCSLANLDLLPFLFDILLLRTSDAWSGGSFSHFLVGEQSPTLLHMPRVSGNAHIGQAQEAFRRHVRNFQAIEVLRFQTRDDALDRLAGDLLFVSAEGDHLIPPAM